MNRIKALFFKHAKDAVSSSFGSYVHPTSTACRALATHAHITATGQRRNQVVHQGCGMWEGQRQSIVQRGVSTLGGMDDGEEAMYESEDYKDEMLVGYSSGSLQQSRIVIDGPAPDFSATAVVGNEITTLNAGDYHGKWVLLFFYPKDFTFVCPTEIIAFNDRAGEFEKRGCAVIGASCDSAEVHLAWIRTPRKQGGLGHMEIPLIADVTREVSSNYGALNADNVTNRAIYLISPEGKLKSMQINQNDVGRSVDEALRLLDAYQFVAEHGVVCPADWKPGSATMKADPDASLEYFGSADSSKDDSDDFGRTLLPIKDRAHYEELTSSGKPVVVDFMAGWCGKCRMIAPTVEALQSKYPDITFAKFDTTQESGGLDTLAQSVSVQSLPTFKFFHKGKQALPDVMGYKKRPLEEAVTKLAQIRQLH